MSLKSKLKKLFHHKKRESAAPEQASASKPTAATAPAAPAPATATANTTPAALKQPQPEPAAPPATSKGKEPRPPTRENEASPASDPAPTSVNQKRLSREVEDGLREQQRAPQRNSAIIDPNAPGLPGSSGPHKDIADPSLHPGASTSNNVEAGESSGTKPHSENVADRNIEHVGQGSAPQAAAQHEPAPQSVTSQPADHLPSDAHAPTEDTTHLAVDGPAEVKHALPEGFDLNNTTDTSIVEKVAPAVTHEHIHPEVHHVRHEQIHRDIHEHSIHTSIQPVIDTQVLTPKHVVVDPHDASKKTEIPRDQLPAEILAKDEEIKAQVLEQRMQQLKLGQQEPTAAEPVGGIKENGVVVNEWEKQPTTEASRPVAQESRTDDISAGPAAPTQHEGVNGTGVKAPVDAVQPPAAVDAIRRPHLMDAAQEPSSSISLPIQQPLNALEASEHGFSAKEFETQARREGLDGAAVTTAAPALDASVPQIPELQPQPELTMEPIKPLGTPGKAVTADEAVAAPAVMETSALGVTPSSTDASPGIDSDATASSNYLSAHADHGEADGSSGSGTDEQPGTPTTPTKMSATAAKKKKNNNKKKKGKGKGKKAW